MKKIIAMVLCLMLSLSLIGCVSTTDMFVDNNNNTGKETEPATNEKGPKQEGVSMFVKKETLTNKTATFVLQNNTTDKEYTYGAMYELEKQVDGTWKTFEPKEPLSWIEIAYMLKAGETTEFNVDWTLGYNELSEGTYRLVKVMYDLDGNQTTVYAEFNI